MGATAGQALIIGGSALQAYGYAKAGEAEADVLRLQASQSVREAGEARRLTDYRVRLVHEAGAELLGGIEAETGKSGLALTGTPLRELVTNARRVELTAALEQRAGRVTQLRYLHEAEALEEQARAAKKAGKIKGMAALFGGLGSINWK